MSGGRLHRDSTIAVACSIGSTKNNKSLPQPAPSPQLQRVAVVYNTDYDAELKEISGSDVSAVQQAAAAVAAAVLSAGYEGELLGVHGRDLGEHIALWQREPPDLVFNLVESMCGTTRNEPLFPGLLEMFGIPFTGPGPLCLRLCLHKDRGRDVLTGAGINIPEGFVIASLSDLDVWLVEASA